MPITLAEKDKDLTITRIGGTQEVKQHLADLGFVVGGMLKVVSSINGNLIVSVKGVRIALSEEMARRIMV